MISKIISCSWSYNLSLNFAVLWRKESKKKNGATGIWKIIWPVSSALMSSFISQQFQFKMIIFDLLETQSIIEPDHWSIGELISQVTSNCRSTDNRYVKNCLLLKWVVDNYFSVQITLNSGFNMTAYLLYAYTSFVKPSFVLFELKSCGCFYWVSFSVLYCFSSGVVYDNSSSHYDPVLPAGRLFCLCLPCHRLLSLHHPGGSVHSQGKCRLLSSPPHLLPLDYSSTSSVSFNESPFIRDPNHLGLVICYVLSSEEEFEWCIL